jgi:hypothetical protein
MAHARHEISVGFSDKRFLSGAHICLLYGDDAERLRLLARFFEAGRRDNERMVYVHADGDEAEARAGLERNGFAGSPSLRTRRSDELYYSGGQFVPDRVLEQTRRFYESAVADGFSGGRGCTELWGRGTPTPPSAARVLDYEARLTRVLAEYPSTVVCQYDLHSFDGATLMDLLSVHPYTIVRGQLVVNPYFVEPERFVTIAGFPSGS